MECLKTLFKIIICLFLKDCHITNRQSISKKGIIIIMYNNYHIIIISFVIINMMINLRGGR